MTDPARTDPLYHALAFVHPALAAIGLLAAFFVLRAGLQMRDARVRRAAPVPHASKLHLRFAPPAVWVLLVAAGLGPLSSYFLRHWRPLQTFHGWIGLAAITCFGLAALLGRRLKLDPTKRRSMHGNLGLLGIFLSAIVALTGIALLP